MPSLAAPTGVSDILSGGLHNESNSNHSSGLTMQSDIDEMTIPMESLGVIIDTPMNFEWVFDVPISGLMTNQANDLLNRMFSTVTFASHR